MVRADGFGLNLQALFLPVVLAFVSLSACQAPPPICDPGETQQCTCTAEKLGIQSCMGDGLSWAPCVCGDDLDASSPDRPNSNDATRVDVQESADRARPDHAEGRDLNLPPDATTDLDAGKLSDSASPDTGVLADAALVEDATAPSDAARDLGDAIGSDVLQEDSAVMDARSATDGAPAADSGEILCSNPVVNTGCGQGFKCSIVIDGVSPSVGHSACVPDQGTQLLGEPCVSDGVTGLDDCAEKLICQDAQCAEICRDAPNTCGGGAYCIGGPSVAGDASIGACTAGCDIVTQDCPDSKGCYLTHPYFGVGTCMPATVQPDNASCNNHATAPGLQGDCCSGFNTCAFGYGCLLMAGPTIREQKCAKTCDPTNTIGSSDCSSAGSGLYCVSLNKFYADMGSLADTVGVCIPESIWGPATCFNGSQDSNEDGVDCCISSGNCLCATTCQ